MAVYSDRVKDTTTTTGTGNITLSGTPPSGFRAFSAVFSSATPSDLFNYVIVGQTGSEWEIGLGYLSASTTLVRDRVLESSNSGALVNFSAGTKDVFVTLSARMIADAGVQLAVAQRMFMP